MEVVFDSSCEVNGGDKMPKCISLFSSQRILLTLAA